MRNLDSEARECQGPECSRKSPVFLTRREWDKVAAAPHTQQSHLDCWPFHSGFKGLRPIQGFESGSEQTNGTTCFKETDPELLPDPNPKRNISTHSCHWLSHPKCLRLTKRNKMPSDTKAFLNQMTREKQIFPWRWVINTSQLFSLQNRLYISVSSIVRGKMLQPRLINRLLSFLSHLEGNVEYRQTLSL